MSARLPAVLLVLACYMGAIALLPACCAVSSVEYRFTQEYKWDKYTERTPAFNIPVAFPVWLDAENRPAVLRAVDAYARRFEEAHKWARENFVFGDYTVWVHDSLGGFVAGHQSHPMWARGWQIGKYCIVAWDYKYDDEGRPDGPAEQDIFPALAHEWFHSVLQEQYGNADPGHFLWYPLPEVKDTIFHCRMGAHSDPPIDLAENTKYWAKHFKYNPWVFPSSRE